MDDFTGVGQDSFSTPPAQNPDMWERLTNIMPIIQKGMQRRWGYNALVNSIPSDTNHLESFQRDSDQLRTIVALGPTLVQAFLESGTPYATSIFNPVGSPRMLTSRSFGYFFSGEQDDLKKWDGSSTGGLSKWGISLTTTEKSLSTTATPSSAASSTWASPGNAKIEDGVLSSVSVTNTSAAPLLDLTDFALTSLDPASVVTGLSVDLKGFAGSSGGGSAGSVTTLTVTSQGEYITSELDVVITGGGGTGATATANMTVIAFDGHEAIWGLVSLNITNGGSGYTSSPSVGLSGVGGGASAIANINSGGGGGTGLVKFGAQLLKNGVPYGDTKFVAPGSTNTIKTLGAAGDLWGGTFTADDINSATFGVEISCFVASISGPASATFSVDVARITVFYEAATSAPTVASVASSGDVILTIGRIYFQAFKNSQTGHVSDLSDASASTGPVDSKIISLSDLAVPDDPQADVKLLLSTADGGDPSSLYLVAELSAAATTFDDDTPEETLVLNQLYQFTDDFGNDFGIAGNTPPPPDGKFCIKHLGRLWMLAGQYLFFSKSTAELTLPSGFIAGKWEESWPAENFFDISEGAENGRGLYSDGQTIYVGTERSILRITGDDPTNFSEPEILHGEVGLLNQDVWKTVFYEGTPAGAVWITPDSRVVLSDFNSYVDIGTPIQDVTSGIDLSAATISHAMFVAQGAYDLYILALSTLNTNVCDTVCVLDMRTRKWYVWNLTNPSTAMLFNINSLGQPQWLFSSGSSMYVFSQNTVQDINLTPSILARTSWLHLDNPSSFKLLDELEAFISDPVNTFLTIEAADSQLDFTSPMTVVTNKTFKRGPFRTYKTYLATLSSHHKYFRLSFLSPQNGLPLDSDYLNGYLLRYQSVNNF